MVVGCLALLISAASVESNSAVLVTRRTGSSASEAAEVARVFSAALASEGVTSKLDATSAPEAVKKLGLAEAAACDGKRACVTELAAQLGVEWIIALSVAKVGGDRSIAFELIKQADGKVAERESVVLAPGVELRAEALQSFCVRVRDAMGVRPPPADAPSDAPVVAEPKPEPKPNLAPPAREPPVLAGAPAPQGPPVAAWVLGSAAVVTAIASLALVVTGVGDHAKAVAFDLSPEGEALARYPASEVLRRANDADVRTGVGVGLGAVALGLGTAAVITW